MVALPKDATRKGATRMNSYLVAGWGVALDMQRLRKEKPVPFRDFGPFAPRREAIAYALKTIW